MSGSYCLLDPFVNIVVCRIVRLLTLETYGRHVVLFRAGWWFGCLGESLGLQVVRVWMFGVVRWALVWISWTCVGLCRFRFCHDLRSIYLGT